MTYTRCFTVGIAAIAFTGCAVLTGGPAFADPPDDLTTNPQPSPPSVSISTPEVVEGTGGANELAFMLELDKPASGGESIRFYTQDGQGSAMPVEDHEPVLVTLVFGAGQDAVAASVPLVTDSVPEANEHVLVKIDQPTGLTIADQTGTGVIFDDDAPSISVDDVTLAEGSGGPTGYHFTVSLSEPSTVDVFVSATPTAGTADAGTDWQAFSQLVQFSAGETSHDVVVSVVGDYEPEDDETFTIELSDPAYGVITNDSGLGTILDDDASDEGSGDDAQTRGQSDDTSRDPGPAAGSASDDLGSATTSTTTRPAALDATLASSDDEQAPFSPQLLAASTLVALAAASLAGAVRLRRHS